MPLQHVGFRDFDRFIEPDMPGDEIEGEVRPACAPAGHDQALRLPAQHQRLLEIDLHARIIVGERLDISPMDCRIAIAEQARLSSAHVVIVVAGMEGALPSVVGGLVDVPVIAVPTSVGYGASFGGITALLGMLNSCASGVSVVNIDNGFGAAAIASSINHLP